MTIGSLRASVATELEHQIENHHVPGAAVGVVSPDGGWHVCRGVAHVDYGQHVTPKTLFQIGSITKPITAIAAMRLVEDGVLELESPVRRYLPDWRVRDSAASATVCVEHLLQHTAGFDGDELQFTDSYDWCDSALQTYVDGMRELRQLFAVGESFAYNNAAFSLLGHIIATVRRNSYEQAITELVLDPLSMTHSFFSPMQVMLQPFAVGHWAGTEVSVARPWNIPRAANPAGGLASSLEDQLRFARFVLGDGAPLLSRTTMELMRAGGTQAEGDCRVSLGWWNREVGAPDARTLRIVFHLGGTYGQSAGLWALPDEGVALVVLTNADRGFEVKTRILRMLLDEMFGVRDVTAGGTVDAALLGALPGRYRCGPLELEITREHDELRLSMRGDPRRVIADVPLRQVIGDRLVLTSEGTSTDVDVVRHSDGRPRFIRTGGRLYEPDYCAE